MHDYRASAPPKPRGFKNHLVHALVAARASSGEPEAVGNSDTVETSDDEDELGYHGNNSGVSLVRTYLLPSGNNLYLTMFTTGQHHLLCD